MLFRSKVYIGGGEAEGGQGKVLEYTIQEDQWREIKTPVQYFGMAVVDNQLIITGGVYEEGCPTNEVWVLDSVSGTWTQPYTQQCLQPGPGPPQCATRGGCWWWGDTVRDV